MKKAKIRAKLLLLLLILCISVGYAVLQSDLTINGTAGINNPTWDIHWENVSVTAGSVTGTNVTSPATIDSAKTTVSYSIKLPKPGDFYEFTVDAVNDGTIDAMIDTISYKMNGTEISTLPAYLNYSITYSDGSSLQANQELKASASETYKVRVEFKKDITNEQLPESIQTLNLSFTVNYKQATDAAVAVNHTVSFADDSWSTIVAAVQAGNTSNYNVGDTKTVDMGTLGTHTIRIANKSTPTECSTAGFSQTACGFVLEFADIITTQVMNSTNTNVGGWPASEMRTYVNSDIYNALPTELKNGIINTTVVSGHGSRDSANFTTADKMYLLSTKEVWGKEGTSVINYDSAETETRQLDYYKNAGVTTSNYSVAKKQNNGSNSYWWLRSACSSYAYSFYIVSWNGVWDSGNASFNSGVSPAFRIG
ncbi:MAG: hypothetical protein IJG97_04155 [Bacilli bacterium]|nr:hypothetical protein [Bacilli bacterium]